MDIGNITAKQLEKVLYKKLGCSADLELKIEIKKIGLCQKKSCIHVNAKGTMKKDELTKLLDTYGIL